MKNKKTTTLDINELIAPNLSSRDIILVLKKEIDKSQFNKIFVDFSNIQFVSRSATHELLNLQKQYNTFFSNKKVYFKNFSEEVNKVFNIVKNQPKFFIKTEQTDIQEVNFDEFLKARIV